jgi:hypothetical protein
MRFEGVPEVVDGILVFTGGLVKPSNYNKAPVNISNTRLH